MKIPFRIVKQKKPKPLFVDTTPAVVEIPKSEAPSKIDYEIFRPADNRLVIVKRGRISKKKAYFLWQKRQYYTNHILRQQIGKRFRYFIRWNEYYSEAIDSMDKTIPKFAPELEGDLMNNMVIQFRDAAVTLAGLQIDRTMLILLALAMVFGIPIGLSFNNIFNWVPSTVVHWVTRP